MLENFCTECNNLLLPKIEDNRLVQTCERCDTGTIPNFSKIHTIIYKHTRTEQANKKYYIDDVTLPRENRRCPACSNNTALMYMEESEDIALNSYYMCLSCKNEYK